MTESQIHSKFECVQRMYEPDETCGQVLKRLQAIIEEKYKVKFGDFWDFHKWSIEHIPEFWEEMWDFVGVIYSRRFDRVVDLSDPMHSVEWFPGARLNYAENLLRHRDEDKVALIVAGEERVTRRYTFAQMYEETRRYAAAFRKLGLKKGDVVVCYMSNREEAVFAMQATVSIGAIWTGTLPLLGAEAVLKKFTQVNPKFMLTIDRFKNNNEEIDMLGKVKEITDALPSLEKVIIVSSKKNSTSKNITEIKNSVFLEDFLSVGLESDGSVAEMRFEQVPFSHPVFLNYTSGTTGFPKAILHGFGALLADARDFTVHSDAPMGSVWFSISPVGWTSWCMFSTLATFGHTLLLYEGVPYFLNPDYTIWDMVDEFEISHFFLPASVVDEVEKRKQFAKEHNHLRSLKVFMAGGSVVKPQSYDFVYKNVPKKVIFSSCFGGTELMGSCLMLDTTMPVYRGELSVMSLANNLQTMGEDGEPVIGEIGDLVLTTPSPNLPLGLWGDTDRSVLIEKYFSKYSGVYTMGDYGIINPVTKGVTICCRSDETLKQRGCRFGSAEIYNVVDRMPEVRDSLCVSHYGRDMDERAVLFLRMRPSHCLDGELEGRVRVAIATELTPRHVPDVILETDDIPVNLNGKKMELLVKRIINKMPYNAETIFNPECLDFYKNAHLSPQLREVVE